MSVSYTHLKGRNPTAFFADEVVTTYINGLDNLIATARSNKIAVFLGFQDFSQMVRDYGQKISDAIVNTVNNVFVGAVKGKTAKELAESFGKKTVKKISKSITEDGKVTTSIAEHKEERITPVSYTHLVEAILKEWNTFEGRLRQSLKSK